ncbi:MAG: peptidylprolyl isomerase [Chthoniobacterales bacterium]
MADTHPRTRLLCWLLALNFLLLGGMLWLVFERNRVCEEPVQGIPAVVARVNGRPLYARYLLSAAQLDREPPDVNQLRPALQRLIQMEVVSQRMPRLPSEQVEERMETLSHQFPDVASLNTALQAAGLSENDLRQRIGTQMQVEKWLREMAKSEPTEAECRAWFAAHLEISALPEVAQASHFAAIFSPKGTPVELLEKVDLIHDAQARLADGIPFSQLIDALSDDPAKKITHGSLSWFRSERMEPALVKAAFAQPLNQVGQPVETRFGFHLILVSERHPAVTLSYDDVAAEVRQRCRDEQERKKIDATVTDLVQRAKIEILDPHLL